MRATLLLAVLASTIILRGPPHHSMKCDQVKAKHGLIVMCLPLKIQPRA
jgi:hypothetical protein